MKEGRDVKKEGRKEWKERRKVSDYFRQMATVMKEGRKEGRDVKKEGM